MQGEKKTAALHSVLLLLLVHLPEVELELLALEDVAVSTAGLTGTRGDAGIELADQELISKSLLDLVGLATTGLLGSELSRGLADVGGDLAEFDTIVLEVPCTEGVGIDLDDAVADEGVLTDELVVGGVVDHIDDTAAEGNTLGGPGEVARVETKSTTLHDAETAADKVDALLTDTGHGGLTAELELSLLADGNAGTAGGAALVHRVTGYGHF